MIFLPQEVTHSYVVILMCCYVTILAQQDKLSLIVILPASSKDFFSSRVILKDLFRTLVYCFRNYELQIIIDISRMIPR